MFITCQECNTTFRLDERLLKPTGSKVRCSQCRYTFVAAPPSAKPMAMAVAKAPILEAVAAELPGPAAVEEHEDQSLEGIDLAELDSILESETGAAAFEDRSESLSELEVDLPPDEEEAELDEIDLDFDFDAALEAEDKDSTAQVADVAGKESPDDLGLDMDFEIQDDTLIIKKEEIEGLEAATLTLEEEPEILEKKPAKAASVSKPTLEDDLDMAFKDLEFDLGEEEAPQKQEPAKAKEQRGDSLDLLDLDLDLEGEKTPESREDEDVELSLADDMELELEEKPVAEKGIGDSDKEKAASEDDLGLDLELGELEVEEPAPETTAKSGKAPAKSDDEELDFDLDLGLDMDESLDEKPSTKKPEAIEEELSLDLDSDLEMEADKKEAPAAVADKGGMEDLEELSFEMDNELDEKPASIEKAEAAAPEATEDEGDIDLSDIEQMLGGDAAPAEKAKPAEVTEKDKSLGIDDEIDLQEIESAIDRADEVGESDLEMEEPELELDLETSDAPVAMAQAPSQEVLPKDQADAEPLDLELDLDLELEGQASAEKAKVDTPDRQEEELDLSDLAVGEIEAEKPVPSKVETVHSGDIELDFQIEEEESPAMSAKTTVGKTTARVAEMPVEQTIETKPVEPAIAKRPKPVAPRRKSSKLGVIVLLLLLLAAAFGGIYYAVIYMGIEIPYVSEYLKQKPKDPAGVANLTTLDINSKFIENSQSGRLFVITGKVRNGYGMRRHTIRLQGKLFTKGKVLVKTENSYAGLQMSDQELATLSIAEIKQALNTAPAALDAAGSVKPGQTLPFMVVFSDLPAAEQLDEFAVELVSSVSGQ